LSKTKLPTYSATTLASNSSTTVTLMFNLSLLSNLFHVINLATRSLTKSCTHLHFLLGRCRSWPTSSHIFDKLHKRCLQIHAQNCELFNPCQYAAPAAFAQTFLTSVVGVCLPSHQDWVDAYKADPVMLKIIHFIRNPGLICNRSLEASKLNANYQLALCRSLILIKNGILIYRETIVGSKSYKRLQLVQLQFHNIIFVVFHSNPIGAHLNPYHTFHRVCLQFYWPRMYAYITRMCHACPGCVLSNPNKAKSSKLVYNFLIKAPMMVLHIDAYQAAVVKGFEGLDVYLIACCGMCSFAAMERISNASAKAFASAILCIILCYGFCHMVVLDKDSKLWESSRNLWTCSTLTIMFYLVTTITRGLSNESTGT
jgi:hypothetical protein